MRIVKQRTNIISVDAFLDTLGMERYVRVSIVKLNQACVWPWP